MTQEEKLQVLERLVKLFPLMDKHYPEGWVDFRTPTPPEWRGGLFLRVPPMEGFEEVNVENEMDRFLPGYLDFRCLVGCGAVARLVANDFFRATSAQVQIEQEKHYWIVRMRIHIEDVCW